MSEKSIVFMSWCLIKHRGNFTNYEAPHCSISYVLLSLPPSKVQSSKLSLKHPALEHSRYM
jgi:hypothetical protein